MTRRSSKSAPGPGSPVVPTLAYYTLPRGVWEREDLDSARMVIETWDGRGECLCYASVPKRLAPSFVTEQRRWLEKEDRYRGLRLT